MISILTFCFLPTFFDSMIDVVRHLFIRTKTDERRKRYARKNFKKFFHNFDYFRKTGSPRYERENQTLFTTAFMQRGGDPLWN